MAWHAHCSLPAGRLQTADLETKETWPPSAAAEHTHHTHTIVPLQRQETHTRTHKLGCDVSGGWSQHYFVGVTFIRQEEQTVPSVNTAGLSSASCYCSGCVCVSLSFSCWPGVVVTELTVTVVLSQ